MSKQPKLQENQIKLPDKEIKPEVSIKLKSVDFHTNILVKGVLTKGATEDNFQNIVMKENYISFDDDKQTYFVPFGNVLFAIKL